MWPDQPKQWFRETLREWSREWAGMVLVHVVSMDTNPNPYQRFDDVIAIRKALAKKNTALLVDAISEVDLAVWELLRDDPGVSDRDLYWRAVTKLRRCRRRRIQVLQREVLGPCWDHLADATRAVEDTTVTRIELESTLLLLRDDLHQVVAGSAGWMSPASTATQRTALQRWRAAHSPEMAA